MKHKKKELVPLLNGCFRTEISVTPVNWMKEQPSLLKRDWHIWYRYTDPKMKDKFPSGKLVIVRGMNSHKTLEKRREATKRIIDEQRQLIDVYNYNPITEMINVRTDVPDTNDVDELTPFITALWVAYKRLKFVKKTLIDVKSIIKGIEKASETLSYHNMPISLISRKHIVRIFDECARTNENWSSHRHNKYRAYLLALFKQLVKLEAAEINPVWDIENEPTATNERELLTMEERKAIDIHLKENCYTFWRYTQIFFHSGSRSTELMKVKESQVDIKQQRFQVLIKKRKSWCTVWKPIKDIVLPLWKELLDECKAYHEIANVHGLDLFLFTEELKPGTESVQADLINRKWNKWVKGDKSQRGLNIKKNFYPLKHLNSTEMMDMLVTKDIETAENEVAKLNGHTSPEMLQKVYDVKNSKRKAERIKKIINPFA